MANPEIWGKHGWKFLHYVAKGYPTNPSDNDKQTYKLFLESIQKILPCDKCKKHYKQHLENFPLNDIILSSKENLENWIINIHNQVNMANHKPIVSYEQARTLIVDDTCTDNCDINIKGIKQTSKLNNTLISNQSSQIETQIENLENIPRSEPMPLNNKVNTNNKNTNNKNTNKINILNNNLIIFIILIGFLIIYLMKN